MIERGVDCDVCDSEGDSSAKMNINFDLSLMIEKEKAQLFEPFQPFKCNCANA